MIEWLAMGGYGKFVWPAYAIWLVVIVYNYVGAKADEKKYKHELIKRLRLK